MTTGLNIEREKIIEQLLFLRDRKEKAIATRSFEIAAQLRDTGKELLQKLDKMNENDKKHSR